MQRHALDIRAIGQDADELRDGTAPAGRLKVQGDAVPGHFERQAPPYATEAIHGATALKMEEEFAVEMEMAPQAAELFIPVEQRLTLLQLSEQTCKWPIGDPLTPDFYFCGQHSNEGKPYCEFHSRRAYHQIDKKKR